MEALDLVEIQPGALRTQEWIGPAAVRSQRPNQHRYVGCPGREEGLDSGPRTPGVYSFYCRVHESMRGVIKVVA